MHYDLTPEQKYEFDLRGYLVLRQHFHAEAVAEFHAGIDELQAIPIDYATYTRLGVASYFLHNAMADPEHPFWKGEHRPDRAPNPATGGIGRVDHAICGTAGFDRIVRDPVLNAIHTELAGGAVYLSRPPTTSRKSARPPAAACTTAASRSTATSTTATTTRTGASPARAPRA